MGLLDKPPFPAQLYKDMVRPPLNIVSRSEWGAVPATSQDKFEKYPIPNIIFGYTETEPCTTKEDCIKTMKALQEKHMAEGMSDIRFSFVVGADGNVYEGRGWEVKPGVHYRYPKLNGNNVEVVHTGQKGALPDGELSAILWHLLDQGIWDKKLPDRAGYYLNYEEPPPNHESEEPPDWWVEEERLDNEL